ncbi:PREDICTED: malate dehydrogenase, mitochondrial-like [Rhagoletis zephyria]|uniref:malate dehydrogenase, mitochondrial-like n=1 Tax=Rhagoletis zephyria TaxID=28612 RepID=UPI00081126FA|nr:PREDICTED: malate dehydrogenase, mitochondrial-like [Rhagoletis zephyria]
MLSYSRLGRFVRLLRNFSTKKKNDFKVTLIGCCGGIGQPLALLLKRHELISTLALYDLAKTPGVHTDLSHIDTKACLEGFQCRENLPPALENADVVILSAGFPRKPDMTRDDLFMKNIDIVLEIAAAVGEHCPKALFGIITNPVNSCVPAAAEILKQKNSFDPKRLFGITTLDEVRARTFIGQILDVEPCKVNIPVIGGHSGETIIPVIAQCKPPLKLDKEQRAKLIKQIQEAGADVITAKSQDGGTSATLSMAHAAEVFTNTLLQGLKGDCQPVQCSFVASDVTDCAYFSTPLQFGKNGIEKNLGLPKLDKDEEDMVCKAMETLKKNIKKGIDYAKNNAKKDKKNKKC